MDVEILPDGDAVARRAAALLAAEARAAVAARGRFALALSRTRLVVRALASEQVPWHALHLFQVDERVVPAGHEERNLTDLLDALPLLDPARVHAMPVEEADLAAAAARYAAELRAVAGAPPVLDVVHLGLGADGHTASLFPGDPVLEAGDDVAATGVHQGVRRMTLTFPAIDRARRVVWVVTGAEKAGALARLVAGDAAIPAARVRGDRAVLLADAAAAAGLAPPR